MMQRKEVDKQRGGAEPGSWMRLPHSSPSPALCLAIPSAERGRERERGGGEGWATDASAGPGAGADASVGGRRCDIRHPALACCRASHRQVHSPPAGAPLSHAFLILLLLPLPLLYCQLGHLPPHSVTCFFPLCRSPANARSASAWETTYACVIISLCA